MTFTAPAWLAALVLVIPAILLIHARRRHDLVVPSVALWRLVEASAASRPSPRRIPWRERRLWVQLLAAVALVVALAGPVLTRGPDVEHWVIVVDASLSMNATDVDPSRAEAAFEEVVSRFTGRTAVGDVSVVRAATPARIVAARWPAGPGLVDVHALVAPGQTRPDWTGTALRVEQLLRNSDLTRSRVVVATDAYGAQAAREALVGAGVPGDLVTVEVVGSDLVNVGLDGVVANSRGERGDQWTVTGRVTASGFEAGDVVRVTAAYRFPGTEVFLPWGSEDVVLDRDLNGEFAVPLDLPGQGLVRVSGPEGDHLAEDDGVVLAVGTDARRVAIIGEAPDALVAALAAVGGLEVYAVDPSARAEDLLGYDLVIVTGPYDLVPPTSTLWLGSVPAGIVAGDEGVPTAGGLVTGRHLLMTDVDAAALTVRSATPVAMLTGSEPLLSEGDRVYAWARTASTGRQVVLGFALEDSDWPSQVGFPSFVASLVAWVPRSFTAGEPWCVAGERCEWPRQVLESGGEVRDPYRRVLVSLPPPTAVEDDPLADAVWVAAGLAAGFLPERGGVHVLETASGSLGVPVAVRPLPRQPDVEDTGGERVVPGRLAPVWPWLAALAIALIVLDAVMTMRGQGRAVRRRSRTPVVLACLAALAGVCAVVGVPLPGRGTAGMVTVVAGSDLGSGSLPSVPAAWNTRAVTVTPLPERPNGSSVGDRGEDGAARGAVAADETALAVEMALALPQGGGARRVALAAAPTASLAVGSVADLALVADRTGTAVDVLLLEPPSGPDAALTGAPAFARVTAPRRVNAYTPYQLIVDVAAAPGEEWLLSTDLVGSRESGDGPRPALFGAVRTLTEGSQLPAATPHVEVGGTGQEVVRVDLVAAGQGEWEYRLRLSTPSGVEGPSVTVSVTVGDRLSVLLIASEPTQGEGLAAALAAQGAVVDAVSPLRMPATSDALERFDAVLLVDVAAADLFPEYQVLLERYVRSDGGGVVLFGGPSSFGPGGYYATPLEDLSPLSSVVTDDAPEVAMAFVLDRSGSMSGSVGESTRMELAKAATVEALSLLGENSQVAIVVFDTTARVALPFTPVTERDTIVSALTTVSPGGGTAIYPGLAAAHAVIAVSPAATRHVVVMTDGLSQEGDFEGVLRALNDLGVATSFVGVGEAADRRQLATLAGLSGGTLHLAQDFRALPGLLAQEALMMAAEPVEERTTAVEWHGSGVPGFLEGVDGITALPLHGYVRTTAKPQSAVHLIETTEEDPILATWRYGLGRVASFASEAGGAWAGPWTASPDYGRLWSQVVRWVAQRPTEDPWSVHVAGSGDVLDVSLTLPDAATVEVRDVTVELWSSDGQVRRRQLTAAGAGKAVASFELAPDWSGDLEVRLSPLPAAGLPEGLVRSVAWPLPPSLPARDDQVAPAHLAHATGGEVVELAAYEPPALAPVVAWTQSPRWWFMVALVSFLAALAARYGVLAGVRVSRFQAPRTRTPWPDR